MDVLYANDKAPFGRSKEDFYNYLRGETMAYAFALNEDGSVKDRVLRLDLFRQIDDNDFTGGLFHIFKHFSVEDSGAIFNSDNDGYNLECMSGIYGNLLRNFFCGQFISSGENKYSSVIPLLDGHKLKGIYYKEDDSPAYFLVSLFISK